ncbi:hypothetical protein [Nostoc sp.]|uniref:hypothetical protein n=1 Tax=Nostoc sp. TaxID=1180 RepID=UPI002FF5146C
MVQQTVEKKTQLSKSVARCGLISPNYHIYDGLFGVVYLLIILVNYSDLPAAEVDRSQFIGNSHQLLRSFFGLTFPPLVRSPGSQDPNLSLATYTY